MVVTRWLRTPIDFYVLPDARQLFIIRIERKHGCVREREISFIIQRCIFHGDINHFLENLLHASHQLWIDNRFIDHYLVLYASVCFGLSKNQLDLVKKYFGYRKIFCKSESIQLTSMVRGHSIVSFRVMRLDRKRIGLNKIDSI